MNCRKCEAHITRKRISGSVCVLGMLLLISFIESSAKTFLFKPTKQPANYSDTSNWVNRDYPGRQIVFGDTIAFEINAGFHDVIIDSTTSGLVLKSPNLHYWRIKITDAGVLTATDLGLTKP